MASSPGQSPDQLAHTPLFDAHVALGARMVPFAGYAMPVQYADGIIAEHLWTREHAGLFDVSHMGQAVLIARNGEHETVARALEALAPADLLNLNPGQQRYTQLLTGDGGIFDDLMVSRPAEPSHAGGLVLVVNASRKVEDFGRIEANLGAGLDEAIMHAKGETGRVVVHEPETIDVKAIRAPVQAGLYLVVLKDEFDRNDISKLVVY